MNRTANVDRRFPFTPTSLAIGRLSFSGSALPETLEQRTVMRAEIPYRFVVRPEVPVSDLLIRPGERIEVGVKLRDGPAHLASELRRGQRWFLAQPTPFERQERLGVPAPNPIVGEVSTSPADIRNHDTQERCSDDRDGLAPGRRRDLGPAHPSEGSGHAPGQEPEEHEPQDPCDRAPDSLGRGRPRGP